MIKQVETEKNNSENNNNNNNASHDDLNSIFKNRKIVRIKRSSAIFRDSTRKNESISEDNNNFKKKTTKIVVVHRSTHDVAVVGGSGDNYEQQQFVRLVWSQKRKAVVDEHEEGQEEFSHYRNKRKRIKFNDSDNKAMRAGCTFQHKPDYDFIISWF
ncbi:hypothetical protein FRACYDRAFT_269685 [Fragilariopsis cylindrus CCMP1102]|uniref:Uncharacterized protein n=1 Tax=Fragilariopsis cylindrus CCMP1102 TaxID=635003 RepID=A0A1E7F9K6_9STRA|nr:hypothetical protein FRACYDRAFT_269685 [Fragilariopsis cylindrus CCMP1102]|eukprot:OEU14819.1 hypothetical protein FRACYDRAFT_269685 [Fragilariopsis cylindrus CCMP1102]